VLQTKEAILITDAQIDLPGPTIIFVNPAFTQMTGYTAEEVIGKTPRILQGTRTDKAMLRGLRRSLERGEVFDGEAIQYRKDGTEYDQEWQITPLRDEQEKSRTLWPSSAISPSSANWKRNSGSHKRWRRSASWPGGGA